MNPCSNSISAVCAAILLVAHRAPLQAQETPSDTLLTIEHYLDYETVSEPRLSPDGTRILFSRNWINRKADRWESDLWLMNADGAHARFLIKGHGAVWSSDGTRIAYLAETEKDGPQVFVRWMDAEGATTQVTRVTQDPGEVKWSPDGKHLGFSMFVPRDSTWTISMPLPPEGAQWTPTPRILERLHNRQDGRGFNATGSTHLFVVSADGGTPRQITSGDWQVGARFDGQSLGLGWDWMADGKTVVVDGLMVSNPDLNYEESRIYAVDVATGGIRALLSLPGRWTRPTVSPDGKWIAYLGVPKFEGAYHATDLWVMRPDGSAVTKLTTTLDRDADEPVWSPDASGVYFTAEDQGSRNVLFVSLGGTVRALTTGTHVLNLGSVARNKTAAVVRASYTKPTDLVLVNLRKPSQLTQLTHVNDDLLAHKRLAEIEELWFRSGDVKVQGWIVKPPTFVPTQRYPLILEIHGGPSSMYSVAFDYMWQNFAANGYVVLYLNPRGSTGYGSAFGNAIYRKFPGVDYDDLMAGVDSVIGRGYVDPKRMYVSGCSGGGALSSWVIGHTDRFAAAAVRCPVTNWLSFAGTSDIPLFGHSWFAKPFWEDPEPWLKNSSLMYVGNVKTPTLLMTGVLDLRTPMEQTDEYFAALKLRGVPAAVIRFEGEPHGTDSRPTNFMRTQLYMMSWFQRYTK